MKKINLTVLLLLSIIIACSAQNKYSSFNNQRVSLFELIPILENDIVFVGNSITNGAEWSELFQNSCIKNRGISGDTAEGVLDRISTIITGNPQKIFLMIGVNDLIKGVPPDTVAPIIEKIIKEIQTNSRTTIYLQSVLPANRDFSLEVQDQGGIKGLNKLLMKIAKDQNITYIDLYSHFKCDYCEGINLDYSNDGLHLLGEGYMLWKQIIMPYVN